MPPLLLSQLVAWLTVTSPRGPASYVTLLGSDTVAMETFTRTAGGVEGDLLVRVPGTVHVRYRVELRADGSLARSTIDVSPLGTREVAARRVTLEMVGDSLRATIDSAGRRRVEAQRAPADPAVLFTTGFGASYGLYSSLGTYELALARLPADGRDTVAVTALHPLTARVATRRFVRRSPTAVDVDFFRIAWTHLQLDADGRLAGVDASETTEQTRSHRAAPIDVPRAARAFAERDRAGRGLGAASPNATLSTTVGGGALVVAYGSPRRRGRTILGAVVPYDRPWRTGANEATVLVVERDVTIGGTRVPAGAYSLWTVPRRDGVTLVINRQHGQWGTSYDAAQDLARVPMRVDGAAAPQEAFAITVDGAESARTLRIAWDTFRWSVPVTAP